MEFEESRKSKKTKIKNEILTYLQQVAIIFALSIVISVLGRGITYAMPTGTVVLITVIITAFLMLIGCAIDAFLFSHKNYKINQYLYGILLPYVSYSIISIVCVYTMRTPIAFNLLFLPLRALEIGGIPSRYSVMMVNVIIIISMFVVNRVGYVTRDKSLPHFDWNRIKTAKRVDKEYKEKNKTVKIKKKANIDIIKNTKASKIKTKKKHKGGISFILKKITHNASNRRKQSFKALQHLGKRRRK